jgi:hypothetical protein
LRASEISAEILGDDHPDTLTTMNNLAATYRAQGRTGDAASMHEQVLEKSRRILGDDHPDTLTTMNNLALTYRAQGRMAEATALQELLDCLSSDNRANLSLYDVYGSTPWLCP